MSATPDTAPAKGRKPKKADPTPVARIVIRRTVVTEETHEIAAVDAFFAMTKEGQASFLATADHALGVLRHPTGSVLVSNLIDVLAAGRKE